MSRGLPAGVVGKGSPSAQSRALTVGASSHGLPAAADGAHAYFDELVPDLMASVQPLVAVPVLGPTSFRGDELWGKGDLKSHLFGELRSLTEKECKEPKVKDKLERLVSQILDQFEQDKLHVEAFAELIDDLRKFAATTGVAPLEGSVKLQVHALLAKNGFLCHGGEDWPEMSADWTALIHALRDGKDHGFLTGLVSKIEPTVEAEVEEVNPAGDRGAHGSGEDELRAPEVTQAFTVAAPIASESLFQSAPGTSGREVVRTNDSWSRPGAYMERFAVFVDGCASEASRSGVLGHSGFKYMCVLCGVFAHAMGHSHGKPCCDDCLGCNPTSAKVASSWRLRGAGDFNIHHVPWLGMSSPQGETLWILLMLSFRKSRMSSWYHRFRGAILGVMFVSTS